MDVKWIEKFSLPKLITLLVGIAITIFVNGEKVY